MTLISPSSGSLERFPAEGPIGPTMTLTISSQTAQVTLRYAFNLSPPDRQLSLHRETVVKAIDRKWIVGHRLRLQFSNGEAGLARIPHQRTKRDSHPGCDCTQKSTKKSANLFMTGLADFTDFNCDIKTAISYELYSYRSKK
jgi:hypothetical protein